MKRKEKRPLIVVIVTFVSTEEYVQDKKDVHAKIASREITAKKLLQDIMTLPTVLMVVPVSMEGFVLDRTDVPVQRALWENIVIWMDLMIVTTILPIVLMVVSVSMEEYVTDKKDAHVKMASQEIIVKNHQRGEEVMFLQEQLFSFAYR